MFIWHRPWFHGSDTYYEHGIATGAACRGYGSVGPRDGPSSTQRSSRTTSLSHIRAVEPSRCLANPLVTTMLHFWAAGPSQFRTFVPRDRGSPVLQEQPSRRSCVSTTRLVSAPAFSICGMCIFLRFLPTQVYKHKLC